MGNLWLKIKFWFKLTVFTLALSYLFVFMLKNSGQTVSLWVFLNKEFDKLPLLTLLFITFFSGAIVTLLVRTILTTMRQIRQARAAKLEREAADRKAKASRLQTLAPPEANPPEQPGSPLP